MKVTNHHSAGIVLYKERNEKKEFLLLKYPQGHWDFAKGHLDEGEDVKMAALRELEEETGYNDVTLKNGFLVPMFYEYVEGNTLHKKRVDYFVGCLNFGVDLELSHEHVGGDWFLYEEALNKLTFDNAKDILIAADSFLGMSIDEKK